MSRLLQGEVGSGKTLVALLCMLRMIDNGRQCVLLALPRCWPRNTTARSRACSATSPSPASSEPTPTPRPSRC